MDVLTFHLEIAALSSLVVGLMALRGRLGLGPLYLTLGLLITFVAIGGRMRLLAPVLGETSVPFQSIYYMPLVLEGLVLVYVLEGVGKTRRLIGALAVASLVLFLLRFLLAEHLVASGLDLSQYGRSGWLHPKLLPSLVSTVALSLDGFVIIVAFQALTNFSRAVPTVLALSLALLAGMATDAVVYGGLSGSFDPSVFAGQLVGKLTAGVAAAVPASVYLSWALRRQPELSDGGLMDRGAFEIVRLRSELASVQTALSKTRAEAEHVRQVFSRYVAPDVVEEILDDQHQLNLGGELRDVTIVFSDIRGYSTLSEQMGPEETIELLNQYFAAMSDVIHHFRGTIIEFEGDAILTVFGAPLDQPDHAERAVRAAMMMLEVVDELNMRWDEDGTCRFWRDVGLPTFRVRLGVHSGEVVVGNVGSASRTKYAVIGDTVNTAARVESLNKDLHTTVLISSTTVERLGDVRIPLVDKGEHKVRGRREPVRVYTVRGVGGE